ncbi:hypothetical protein MW887_001843 [Aspergillus wentii]|nr:hypothetical protein MW887_001843 [Aspergillus wentii]
MANQIKTYFLVPNWDFPPDSITLGSIIDDPFNPSTPLYTPDTLHEHDLNIFKTTKSNLSQTIEHSRTRKIGLFAKFLQICGLGAEASISREHADISSYSFEKMDTAWISPSQDLIEQLASHRDVNSFLKQTNYKEPVYIITGIKTVEGARVRTLHRKDRGKTAMFGLDGSATGLPISAGPQVDISRGDVEEAQFEHSSPFVFAYRVVEVRVDGKKGVRGREYAKGALFGVGDRKETMGVATGGLSGDYDMYESLDEDEGECVCVIPVDGISVVK